MKTLALLLAIPLLIGTPQAQGSTPQETQQECEEFCMSCLANDEGEGSFCMAIYKSCCSNSGGTPYNQCGCRIEM